MYQLGLLFLAATALAQPTLYLAKSSIAYPGYHVFLDGSIPEVAIVTKEPEATVEPGKVVIPEAPVLEPLFISRSLVLEEPNVEIVEKKEEELETKNDEEPTEEIEKKEEELEHKIEEDLKEEVLKEEAPTKVESEEDKKIVVQLDVPNPPKIFSSYLSSLPIRLPSIKFPFDFGSWWKPKEREIKIIPAYGLRGLSI